MRIPVYTSGSKATSEAPGQSFSARKSTQPFVQAELQKGSVTTALLGEVNQFAQMRYKAAREVEVQQKILAGEEVLRKTARDLENINTNKLGSVFNDGGKPEEALWNQSIDRARSELLSDVKDKESIRAITQRFNQMELTQRYSLRGRVDQKIQAANNAARAANARRTAAAIATGKDISVAQMELKKLGVDSKRLADLKIGNPDALKKQEYAVVFDGALGAVQNYVLNQDSRYQAAESLREALREGDPTLAGNGQYAFAVLSMLPPKDQAKILDSVGSTAKFIDAPTLEEKRQQTIINATADNLAGRVDIATKALESNMDVSIEDISMLNDEANKILGSLDGDTANSLSQKVTDLNSFNEMKTALSELGSPDEVAKVVADARAGAFSGNPGSVDTKLDIKLAEFAGSYHSNMIQMLKDDPLAFAAQSSAINVNEIDLSVEAFTGGETGIGRRQLAAAQASAFYNTPPTLLTNQEAQKIVGMVQSDVFGGAAILGSLSAEAGQFSESLIDQLAEQGLKPEFIKAMYTTNPVLQKTLAQVSEVPLSDLKTRVNSLGDTKNFSNITRHMTEATRDLFSAYIIGGGPDAQTKWESEFEVAQKLASTYMIGGMSVGAAASRAAKEAFPYKDNAFATNKGTYYVPGMTSEKAAQVSSAATMLLQNEKIFDYVPIKGLETQYPSYVGEALNEASISSRGQWLTNGTNDGLVLHYRMSDDTLLPVFKDDGTTFDLSFKELLDLQTIIGNKMVEKTGAGPVSDADPGSFESVNKKRNEAANQ